MGDLKEERTVKDTTRFRKFIKRAGILFFVLLVAFTMIGLVPMGVRELNNFFFSLFIKEDARLKELEEIASQMENPTVTLFSIKKEAGATAYKPATSLYNSQNAGDPLRIIIPKISVDSKVLNPQTTNVDQLDAALLSGVVRYPGTGNLLNSQTMFLFGHGSNLPVVRNQAFKVFTRLKELQVGDEVFLRSSGLEKKYKVRSVSLVNANTDIVQVSNDSVLVLLTCNTLGKKEDRYIVYADFVGSYNLTN